MPDVIHRTTRDARGALLQRSSMHAPGAEWLSSPTFAQVQGIPRKYWKVAGETVVEMTIAEKSAMNTLLRQARRSSQQQRVEDGLATDGLVAGLDRSVVVTGLELRVSVGDLLTDDLTVLAADPVSQKHVRALLVRRMASPAPVHVVLVLERTDGLFASLTRQETTIAVLGDWTISPNGAELMAA